MGVKGRAQGHNIGRGAEPVFELPDLPVDGTKLCPLGFMCMGNSDSLCWCVSIKHHLGYYSKLTCVS